jgi:nucleoside-diphosphate-sugar epimerase
MGEVMPPPATEAELEDRLAAPSEADIACLRDLPGDIIVLGASGKMGPSLARRVKRASDAAGRPREVIAVARFQDEHARDTLGRAGLNTIAADLLDPQAFARLPDAPNVLFLVGRKFGTAGQEHLTWATNTIAPLFAMRRYPASRIVVLSTGNVYPPVAPDRRGSRETDPIDPVGEYAQSCVGRERIAEYCSRMHGTPTVLLRLNYASDLRYGVLVDIARKVRDDEPIDLGVAYVNTIWQGDANSYALRVLPYGGSPPVPLNVTGPDILRVRDVAEQFGRAFGRTPRFAGREGEEALLSDANTIFERLGPPAVSTAELLDWTAAWVGSGRALLGKPTAYDLTSGRF